MKQYLFIFVVAGVVGFVVTALQHWLQKLGREVKIEAGDVWTLKPRGPFEREPVYCKVDDVREGWVQYHYLKRDATEYESKGKDHSERIANFVEIWERVEVLCGRKTQEEV